MLKFEDPQAKILAVQFNKAWSRYFFIKYGALLLATGCGFALLQIQLQGNRKIGMIVGVVVGTWTFFSTVLQCPKCKIVLKVKMSHKPIYCPQCRSSFTGFSQF